MRKPKSGNSKVQINPPSAIQRNHTTRYLQFFAARTRANYNSHLLCSPPKKPRSFKTKAPAALSVSYKKARVDS